MIRVGQVVGAFGIRGAVKVVPLTDFDDRFAPGSRLVLDGRDREVEWSREQPTGLVVKFTSLDDRTAAEQMRGRYLEIPESGAHALPEGAWYHHELVGMEAVTAGGRSLGRIEQVLEYPANDVWVARGDREILIPATRDAVSEVDVERRRVTVADWVTEIEDA